MCRKLGLSRSGYYAWRNRSKSQRAKENEKLLCQIEAIHDASRRTYGSPRVHAALCKRGYCYNRKRVARLMRENRIIAKMTEKFRPKNRSFTHYRGTSNLLLNRKATTGKNQVWVGDITYIRVNKRWSYFAAVMDLHTRRIIGWSFSAKRTVELVKEAVLMAVCTSKPTTKTIFHSDQGIEYAANDYRKMLLELQLIPSMSRKGCCWDNAYMESFFHTLKTEMVYFQQFTNLAQAMAYIMDYITFYNTKRLHSGLDYNTPKQCDRLAA